MAIDSSPRQEPYAIKNYGGTRTIHVEKRCSSAHIIRRLANCPIIFLRPTTSSQDSPHRLITSNTPPGRSPCFKAILNKVKLQASIPNYARHQKMRVKVPLLLADKAIKISITYLKYVYLKYILCWKIILWDRLSFLYKSMKDMDFYNNPMLLDLVCLFYSFGAYEPSTRATFCLCWPTVD